MKFCNPEVELIDEPNALKKIERVARICYNSEDKITNTSYQKFTENLLKNGHMSPFEHARILITKEEYDELMQAFGGYGFLYRVFRTGKHVSINVRDYMNAGGQLKNVPKKTNSTDCLSVKITCDIGTAREFLRHRIMSFQERSTRYCNYKNGIEFMRPIPFDWATSVNSKSAALIDACRAAEESYQQMIKCGCKPQEARSVLPLCTKTVLVMSGTEDAWDSVFQLRMDNAAHPTIHYICNNILELAGFESLRAKYDK